MSAFFPPAKPIAIGDLASIVGAELRGADDHAVLVDSVGPLENAEPGSLSFLNNRRYTPMLKTTRAAAVIVGSGHLDHVPPSLPVLIASDPYRAFALAATHMFPAAMRPLPIFGFGIAEGAHIHPAAELEEKVTADPSVVVGEGARIGSGTVLCAGAVIGPHVTHRTRLHHRLKCHRDPLHAR